MELKSRALTLHKLHLKQGKFPHGQQRSDRWPTFRKRWLEKHGSCVVCGATKDLEVHHKFPFHLDPQGELDESNFITLCESKGDGLNCHLAVGHLGSFKSYNKHVVNDAAFWAQRIKERP